MDVLGKMMQELKHLVTSLSQSRAERSELMDAAVYLLSSVSGRSPKEQWAGSKRIDN